jgi:hypothetical protein
MENAHMTNTKKIVKGSKKHTPNQPCKPIYG